ncbi:MAG: Stp1/IreP family PP2C-type Ser/Thr phosphatase [Bacteroidales bacterium]|jgi:serine/threonine protein phosphatase PrpC|nr:Stp1/IreP family PP2C-type Ser/Thr phosphatase [Bacteroidales bacterium]
MAENKNSLNIFLGTDVGRVRKANEDFLGERETVNGRVFVVCDGMGGHVGGAKASNIAVNSILDFLSKEKYEDLKRALSDALIFANLQILGYAQESPEFHGMGTTACILLLKDEKAWIAHVGDSRIYLYLGKEKQLHRITKDHSFVQGLVDQGMILDEEAEHHPQKNVILKALGIKEDLNPEVCQEPVIPLNNDIFLICSDGLSGMIEENEIEKILKENQLQEAGNLLITTANNHGGKDNITVELIKIQKFENKNRNFVSKNPANRQFTNIIEEKKSNKKTIIIIVIAMLCVVLSACALYFAVPTLKKILDKNKTEKQENPIIPESNKDDVPALQPVTDLVLDSVKLGYKAEISYTGEINIDSLPDGQGLAIFLKAENKKIKFEGIWENGKYIEGILWYKGDKEKKQTDSIFYKGTIKYNDSTKVFVFENGTWFFDKKDTTKNKWIYIDGKPNKIP